MTLNNRAWLRYVNKRGERTWALPVSPGDKYPNFLGYVFERAPMAFVSVSLQDALYMGPYRQLAYAKEKLIVHLVKLALEAEE